MMRVMNSSIKKLFFGKKAYQKVFRRLFDIAIEGMNIGTGGGSPKYNGEDVALEQVLKGKKGAVVFDVGAQGGGFTNRVLEVSPDAQVYAFEPRAKDYADLKKLFGSKVTVIASALGEAEGEITLYYPTGKSGISSLYKLNDAFDASEKVRIQTIDGFCRAHKIAHIDLLKLDVEGHELSCLRGAQTMLPHITSIQFEISIASRDARVYFRDIFEYLKDYKVYRILRDGLFEIKTPERITELLFTTNYLAVRRE
jgi:FkbM family methyltransferase